MKQIRRDVHTFLTFHPKNSLFSWNSLFDPVESTDVLSCSSPKRTLAEEERYPMRH